MVAINVRNVPVDVRNELAARAARNGQSLQEYVRGLLIAAAARPTSDDIIARARVRVEAAGTDLGAATILAAKYDNRP